MATNIKNNHNLNVSIEIAQVNRLKKAQLQPNTQEIWIQIQNPQGDHKIQTKRIYLGQSVEQKQMASLIRNKTPVVDQQAVGSIYSKVLTSKASQNQKYVNSQLKWNQCFCYNMKYIVGDRFIIRVLGSRSQYNIENMSTKILKLQGQRKDKANKNFTKNYTIGQSSLYLEEYIKNNNNRLTDIQIPVKVHGAIIAYLVLNLTFYKSQEIVGSIYTPSLSLAPMRFPLAKNNQGINNPNSAFERLDSHQSTESSKSKTQNLNNLTQNIKIPQLFNCCDQISQNSQPLQLRNLFKAKRIHR